MDLRLPAYRNVKTMFVMFTIDLVYDIFCCNSPQNILSLRQVDNALCYLKCTDILRKIHVIVKLKDKFMGIVW